MESYLFLVSPIWWDSSTTAISLLIASMIGMTYVVYRFIKTMRPITGEREVDFIFTSEQDTHWEEKTLERIKNYLIEVYRPSKTTSHTVEEMKHYITNQEFITLLNQIESAEYSKRKIPLEERKNINTDITRLLPLLSKSR